MKNQRKWFNGFAVVLLIAQIAVSSTGAFAQSMLNDKTSHASTVVQDLYFQNAKGSHVSSINSKSDNASTIYMNDTNSNDSSVTINLPDGIDLDQAQTNAMNSANKINVSYDSQNKQVTIAYPEAKTAIANVAKQQQVLSQAQNALNSLQNGKDVKADNAEIKAQISAKQTEIKKAQQALEQAEADAKSVNKLAGLAFTNKSKNDQVLTAQTVRNNAKVSSASLNVRAPKQAEKKDSASTTEKKDSADSDSDAEKIAKAKVDAGALSKVTGKSVSTNIDLSKKSKDVLTKKMLQSVPDNFWDNWQTDAVTTGYNSFEGQANDVSTQTYSLDKMTNGRKVTQKGDTIPNLTVGGMAFGTTPDNEKGFVFDGKFTVPTTVTANGESYPYKGQVNIEKGRVTLNNGNPSDAIDFWNPNKTGDDNVTIDSEDNLEVSLSKFTVHYTQDIQALEGKNPVYQYFFWSRARLPQVVKVYYKDLDTGKELATYDTLGKGGKLDDPVTANNKDFSSQGYHYIKEQYLNSNGADIEHPGQTSDNTTLRTDKQAVIFWYSKKSAAPTVEKSVKDLTNGNDLNKVRVGDTLEYTINATNRGDGDWSNVVVNDTIPEGLDDIDVSKVVATLPDGSTVPTSDITYDKATRKLTIKNIGTLKSGESVKIVFPATVNEDAVGKNIANVAMAEGNNPDGSTTGGSDDQNVTPPDYNDPKPKVEKSVKNLSGSKDVNDVRVGDTLEYTIDTTNTAKDSILKNVVVSDKIPEGLDLDQASVKAYGPDGKEITGAQVSYENGQLVVSGLGDLKYNEHIKVVFQAKVNKDAIGKNIVNIADVTGNNPDGSTTGGNGTDSTPIPNYRDPKPEVKKSVKDLSNNNDLDKVRVGDTLQYTIDTTNTAEDSILKNVVVSDKIPDGLDIDLSSVKAYGPDGKEITGAQVSKQDGKLIVTGLGDLKYNEHIKVVFNAKVNEDAVGNVIENIANVTGNNPDGSTTGGNGTDTTPVPDYNDPKPEVKKSVKDLSNNNDLNKVRVGDDLEYTIDTTNTAKDSILKNVVVSDKIPEGLDLDQTSVKAYGPDGKEITGAQVSYENGQLVVSGLGDLKYNEHIKVVFTAKVNEKAAGNVIENIADVTGENPDGSTTGDKGTDSTPTPDYNDPKPEVKKSVKDLTNGNDLNKVRVGDDLEYTIDTTNVAKDSILKNVTVTDNIPEGLDLDQSTIKAYDNDGNEIKGIGISYKDGKLVVSGLGDLKYDEHIKVVFTAKVNEKAVGNNIVNVADVTGNNPDGSTTGGNGTDSTPVPDYNDPKPEVKKSVKDLSNNNNLDKVRVGDDLEYTIDTTNTAKDSILKNVVVSDKIPDGLDIDLSSVKAYGPDGNEITGAQVSYKNGQLVVSGLGDLKYNEHIKVVFTAKVNEKAVGNTIVNIADVTGENPDGSTTGGNGTDSTPTPDYNDPKPEVKKSVKDLSNNNDLNKVRVGDDLEYTIDTTNVAKDSILKNVVVSDKIPEGLDLDQTSVKAYGPDGKEITGAQVSYENGELVVSGLGDLKYNEHIKVVFTAKVNEKAAGNVIENIADVTGENPDGSTTGDKGTDSTPTPNYNDPKPEVKKSVKDLTNGNDLNKVRVGDDLEYTIDTTNTAKDSILKNVVISDKIPEGLDLDQSSVKAYGPDGKEITGISVSYKNGELVVSGLGDLKYNEHIKVVFTAKVNEKAVGNNIVNVADVTGENPDGSTTGGNGTDSTPIPDYNAPKPEVKKSVKDLSNNNDLDKVRVGDTLQYTIDTTNVAKDSILKNVVVTDDLPEGIDIDLASVKAYGPDGKEIAGAQVSKQDGKLIVTGLGDLKYNEHIKVIFNAKVNEKSVGNNIVNIADVTGENPDGSTTGGNGTDSTPIPDYKDPKPEVKKSVKDLTNGNDLNKVRVGDTLQYTITATNTAKDSIWKNVIVNDQLPSELDFNNDVKVYLDGKNITSKVTVGYSNGVLTVMNIGDLRYNQQVKVVFTEQVTSRATGKEVVNIAEATGNNPDGSVTGDHDSTVTPQNPEDPNNPNNPSDPGNTGSSNGNNPSDPGNTGSSNGNNGDGSGSGITGLLPQTGEARDTMLVIIGLIVLSTVSLIVYFKKRSKQTM